MESYTEVFVWGNDHSGQLGLNSDALTYNIPTACNWGIHIRQVSCGDEHTCVLSTNGDVFCLGSNSEGKLGIGTTAVPSTPHPVLVDCLISIVKVACGWGHSIALCRDGSVFAWGQGEFGALGIDSTHSAWKPVEVRFPNPLSIQDISCGARHSAFLADEGVYMCGAGGIGQLGTGRRENELSPVRLPLNGVVQVACGVFHTGFLTSTGTVLTTGANSFGQLGHGSKTSTSVPIRIDSISDISKIALGSHSACINTQGELFIWGTGPWGEFLSPRHVEMYCRLTDLAMGASFGVCIDQEHSVYTWGTNTSGELGQGDFLSKECPILVKGLQGKLVDSIACGSNFAVALGEVFEREGEREILNERVMFNTDSLMRRSANFNMQEKLMAEFHEKERQLQSENMNLTCALKEVEHQKNLAEEALRNSQIMNEEFVTKYRNREGIAQEHLQSYQDRIAQLEEALRLKSQEAMDYQNTAQEYSRRISELHERIAAFEQNDRANQDRLNSYIASLESTNAQLNEEIFILQNNADESKNVIHGLEMRISSQDKEILYQRNLNERDPRDILSKEHRRKVSASAMKYLNYESPLKFMRSSIEKNRLDSAMQTFDQSNRTNIQTRITALLRKHDHNAKILSSNNY